jgi:septum formation protein
MPPLILASTSRYRRELLSRLGVPFTAIAPGCDEDRVKLDTALSPRQVAETLAALKASSIAATRPDAAVIGSDQLVAFNGRILGKAGTPERAAAQLQAMNGAEHELITAVHIAHPGGIERHTAIARLRMRRLTPEQIARYVAADQPLDCAGSYKLECRGIALFERIDCEDQSAIVGLPLLWLTAALARLGCELP